MQDAARQGCMQCKIQCDIDTMYCIHDKDVCSVRYNVMQMQCDVHDKDACSARYHVMQILYTRQAASAGRGEWRWMRSWDGVMYRTGGAVWE